MSSADVRSSRSCNSATGPVPAGLSTPQLLSVTTRGVPTTAREIAQAGLHPGGARQVPGLRREAIAPLAGLSTDYYIQLEQGREGRPSLQVVDALARALRLVSGGHHHLRTRHHAASAERNRDAEPDRDLLAEVIHSWSGTPAMVVTARHDVLARHDLADALYDGLPHRDNLARMTFFDDRAREFVEDWQQLARCTVGTLRSGATPGVPVPSLTALVAELSEGSEEFRHLWARQDVHRKGSARKLFNHRLTGPLPLYQHVMTLPQHPGTQLCIYQAEPRSGAEAKLDRLRELTRPPRRTDPPARTASDHLA